MDDRSAESSPILARMSVPPADSLFCFTASIDRTEEKDPSAKSDFHWQIIKCRMLLFAVPVLACPVQPVSGGPLRDITVVCRREDIADVPAPEDAAFVDGHLDTPDESEVRSTLARLRLTASRLRPVSDVEYSACLRYTLTARLSPQWNPLGADAEHLVQGKDFLTSGRPAEAVRLEVNAHGERGVAWLGLSFCRLRIAPLTFGDLDVSITALERLQKDPLAVVTSTCIGRPWVQVLPSLKKGVVMEISKTMPTHCPFRSYKNIRRHWKNMYGYRLAEEPQEVVYVSIYFSLLGSTLMSYPLTCLTPRPPAALRSLDPQAVAVAFLGDVATRMTTVCGTPSPVAVDGLVRPVVALQSANAADSDSDASDWTAHPNLRPVAHAALAENANGYSSSSSSAPTPPREDDCSTPSTCPLSLATQRDGTRPNLEWNVLKRAPRGRDDKENIPPGARDGEDPRLQAPHRPVFGARAPVPVQHMQARPVPKTPWFRPTFTSTPTRVADRASSTASSVLPRSSPPSASPSESPDTPPSSASSAAATPYKPVFRVPANKPIFLPRLGVPARKAPKKAPAKAGQGRATAATPRPPGPTAAAPATSPRIATVAPGEASSPLSSGTSSGAGVQPCPPFGAAAPGALPRAAPAAPASPRAGASPSAARKAGAAGKRSSTEAPLVPELPSADAARRASIPMLLAWLRSRGVPCRTKDKKAELVEKVVAHLGGR